MIRCRHCAKLMTNNVPLKDIKQVHCQDPLRDELINPEPHRNLAAHWLCCFSYREFSIYGSPKIIKEWPCPISSVCSIERNERGLHLDENISSLSNVVTMQPWIMEPSTKELYTEEVSISYEQNGNVKFQVVIPLLWTSTDLALSQPLYCIPIFLFFS